MDPLKELSLKELKEKCREQTQNFHKGEEHTTRYCYELFRRAFEEKCDISVGIIYNIYKPLVLYWVKNHSYFNELNLEVDGIVMDSMSQFIFALRRYPFSNFSSLGALLAYWRKCVHTVLLTERRKNERKMIDLEDVSDLACEPNYEKQIIVKELWNHMKVILPESKDLLLSRLLFVSDMKPRTIVKEFPEIWKETNDVRVNQQKIKRILRKDEKLLDLLKEIVT
ncbi:MAG: hypothetical protein JXJ04_02760 [Spirochaetales bacterium]|nr:hypothetical protein [Spirochaetales bacterium]